MWCEFRLGCVCGGGVGFEEGWVGVYGREYGRVPDVSRKVYRVFPG